MNERIKEIRKYFGFNQKEFAEKLGITQSGVSWMEQPQKNVSDQNIRLICTLFNVNETWLRTGEGELFAENKKTVLSKAAELLNLDDTEQKFLSAYLSLDQTQRENFKEFWRQISLAYNHQNETAATISTRPVVNDERLTREQKEELIRQQLDAEEKGETLSASTSKNGSRLTGLA
ncbi:MAG: helix-turn-helix transcriptional regulator [Phycisphaerales bacterium]